VRARLAAACPAIAPKKDRGSRRLKSQAQQHRHTRGWSTATSTPRWSCSGELCLRHLAINLASQLTSLRA